MWISFLNNTVRDAVFDQLPDVCGSCTIYELSKSDLITINWGVDTRTSVTMQWFILISLIVGSWASVEGKQYI